MITVLSVDFRCCAVVAQKKMTAGGFLAVHFVGRRAILPAGRIPPCFFQTWCSAGGLSAFSAGRRPAMAWGGKGFPPGGSSIITFGGGVSGAAAGKSGIVSGGGWAAL